MNEKLQRLARAYDVALQYHDIWGALHRVDDDALRGVLEAMHVRSETDSAVERSLHAREQARWRERLAPMTVVRINHRPWKLTARLPARYEHAPLAWRVVSEAGEVQERPVETAHVTGAGEAHFDGERYVAREIELPFELSPGYHRVVLIAEDELAAEADLAVTPAACYRPPPLAAGAKLWGASVQLYGLRSARNFGIGDFTDLSRFATLWGNAGASIVGVNPLHALFPHNPSHASPYSPSSRLFLDALYLDVEAIPGYRDCRKARSLVASAAFREQLSALRDAPLVDYAGVADAKREVLELVYADARAARTAKARTRWARFEGFRAAGGEALRRHARFEALQEHFHREDAAIWGWPVWPKAYRDPASEAVQRFAEEHIERVDFYAWLQWQASVQRASAASAMRDAGLAVGLYTDLAVSTDRGGAEAWANQDLYAIGASVGAPPDAFNVGGQDWGLPPPIPERLRAAAFAPFIAVLRANMRDAGALRIDHVMGLLRLYWVPAGAKPSHGAFVHYPFDALLALLALESHRNRCAVIGEDLGTVPDEVRAALAENDILSYRVLLFERDSRGAFKLPLSYPEQALATASTHDLPTLAAWWTGDDVRLRAEHELGPHPDVDAQLARRIDEQRLLLEAFDAAGVLPQQTPRDPLEVPAGTAALAAQRFLARSPSALMVVQPEDVFGVREQANLPGTIDTYPNWRRKLPVAIERQPSDARFRALAAALDSERPVPERQPPPAPARRVGGSAHPTRPTSRGPAATVPRSTYRLQLSSKFTFDDVAALIPYLAALGISHVYCSPYLRARPGSLHGYDIVDHRALNPEMGGRDAFERMVEALRRHGMSHLCDVVPNHMAIMGEDNVWWMDVLENGRASPYADYFDIDWTPPDPALLGKVLVPVLGAPYGDALDRGEIRLVFEAQAGTLAVRYFDHRLPTDPREYPRVLELAFSSPLRDDASAVAFRALVSALRTLPSRDDVDPERVAERRQEAKNRKTELARLVATHSALREAIEDAVARMNDSAGREALHELLEAQAFRLAFWRVAGDDINYRRFFDINELAALRIESPAVFEATHDFVLSLAAQDKVGGLRIDHPDGLADPHAYFERLQSRYRDLRAASGKSTETGIYVVIEKISAPHEHMPEAWPIHGHTGYPFANAINAVLVDPTARSRIERIWRAFVGGEARDYDVAVYEGKRLNMDGSLAAGVAMLAARALEIARADRHTRDFTFSALRQAIEETIAWFPVYRTYVSMRGSSTQDVRYIDWAVARARRMTRLADASVFDFVRMLLFGAAPTGASSSQAAACVHFAMRFQQYTAPVAAKGVEDTAFYAHTRLVSLNDVGGDPSLFGMTRRAFHRGMAERFARWPFTLLATSTHDNKRSEDVRARIDVISERAAPWRLAVQRFAHINWLKKREVDGVPAPSRNDEYLLYQTLVGSFPPGETDIAELDAYRERIAAYMLKAARESKRHTSWLAINAEYEDALTAFVTALLEPRGENAFLEALHRELPPYCWFGLLNSLSMALVKLTAPGVPDIYQGNEMLDCSLVDPDNRRPVDFEARRAALETLRALGEQEQHLAEAARALFERPYDGRAKLWLTHRILDFRTRHAALFAEGDYLPVASRGARSRHVLAFARRHGDETAVIVAGRLFASLALAPGDLPLGEGVWADAALDVEFLPEGMPLINVLTGEVVVVDDGRLPIAAIFASFPAALLTLRTPART